MLAEAYHTKFFAGHEFSPNEAKCLSLLITTHSMMYAISTNEFSEVFELGHLEFTNQPNKEIKDNASFFLQNFSLHHPLH